MVYDSARQQVVLFGGTNDQGSLNDTWTWDGKNWAEQHPRTSPPQQCCDAAAFDSDKGVVVLFDVRGKTWTWDGSTWSQP